MKSYTDLKQSENLSNKLPLTSADMHYKRVYFEGKQSDWFISLGKPIKSDDIIPCWSLAALMDMLPSKFTQKGKYSETTYKIHIRKYALTEDVDLYQIAYGNYKFYEDGSSSWKDMINTGEKENLIDAVFQMICWLKENKKL